MCTRALCSTPGIDLSLCRAGGADKSIFKLLIRDDSPHQLSRIEKGRLAATYCGITLPQDLGQTLFQPQELSLTNFDSTCVELTPYFLERELNWAKRAIEDGEVDETESCHVVEVLENAYKHVLGEHERIRESIEFLPDRFSCVHRSPFVIVVVIPKWFIDFVSH